MLDRHYPHRVSARHRLGCDMTAAEQELAAFRRFCTMLGASARLRGMVTHSFTEGSPGDLFWKDGAAAMSSAIAELVSTRPPGGGDHDGVDIGHGYHGGVRFDVSVAHGEIILTLPHREVAIDIEVVISAVLTHLDVGEVVE